MTTPDTGKRRETMTDLDLIDELLATYADRLARGEDPGRDALLDRAGPRRAELEQCLAVLEELEGEGSGSSAASAPIGVGPGLVLGDFRLGAELGRGGMAVVYEAEQLGLGRKVALKVLRHHLTLDERALERFQREARAAARLAHPHVVPIHAVGRDAGHAYIAFERIPPRADGSAPTLERVVELLAEHGGRPSARALAEVTGRADLASEPSYAAACVRLLEGVFAAVEHAHAHGVIHRDLKPSNVLLTPEGKALVADFGLAKDQAEATLSITGETLGTPHYMSPEQAQALSERIDGRTDVYSLGVMLYELVGLRRPFEGPTFAKLVHSIVGEPPRPLGELAPGVPQALCDVVHRALAKEREARSGDVAGLVRDLRRALEGEPVDAQPTRGWDAMFRGWMQAERDGTPFEYRTRAGILGLPWIHIALRVKDPATGRARWARGVIAVGDCALGVYAAGKVAIGFLCLGMLSFGVVALGALAVGLQALGGLAVGWHAEGLMAAGRGGRGLLHGLFAVAPEAPRAGSGLDGTGSDPFLVTVVGVALCFTVFPASFAPLCRTEEDRTFLRRITRLWMPPAFALPVALHLAGIRLPFMGSLLLIMGISLVFSLAIKRRLGRRDGRPA